MIILHKNFANLLFVFIFTLFPLTHAATDNSPLKPLNHPSTEEGYNKSTQDLDKKISHLSSEVVDLKLEFTKLFISLNKPALFNWSLVLTPAAALIAFLAAIYTVTKNSRTSFYQRNAQFFSEKWADLISFIMKEGADYMILEKNKSYKSEFKDKELVKYEMLARRCIGYVDDIYFSPYIPYEKLGSVCPVKTIKPTDKDHPLNTWLKGSVTLLVKPHETWYKENRSSYAPEFVEYIDT